MRTIFADVNKDRVEAAAASSAQPKLAIPWVGDLARRDACDALLAHARSTLGLVTHFVHSAAPPRREADHSLAVTSETWKEMHAVNIDAGFHLARELARQLIAAREPGSFLMLTSLHADTPRNLPHYSTAKAALAMLVKELAKTLGRFNIRVNALVPGAIAAGGFVADPALARHIPLGRLGQERRSRADGAGDPLEPDIGLRDRRGLRRRRRHIADELVRSAGARRSVMKPSLRGAFLPLPARNRQTAQTNEMARNLQSFGGE